MARKVCLLIFFLFIAVHSLFFTSCGNMIGSPSEHSAQEKNGREHEEASFPEGDSEDKESSEEFISREKEQLFALLNTARLERGLRSLELSEELSSVAQLKAEEMASLQYISNISPNYGLPYQMAFELGAVGDEEWVIENRVLAKNAAEAHRELMDIFASRTNMLYYLNMEVGIGIAEFSPGRYIFVQLFTLPMRAIE
ncbi:MAG: CAP domain-containing protein [Dethiobacteria bacterium]|jgi:uncharacterized protein YkwD|nr:hypothetical protein [Bacillota bacterium]